VDLVRAQIAFAVNRGSDAPPLLLRAAKRLEPLDVALARETYRDAYGAAMFAGRLATGSGLRNVATAARAAPSSPQPPRAPDLLLDGLARRFTDGYAAGAPMLKRALGAFRSKDLSREEGLWLACTTLTCGTTRPGRRSLIATSSWFAMPGRLRCCPLPLARAAPCTCTRASCAQPQRCLRR
jgi:hypothetical protein